MFIMSMRLTKKRLITILAAVVIVVGGTVFAFNAKTLISNPEKDRVNYKNASVMESDSVDTIDAVNERENDYVQVMTIEKKLCKKVKDDETRIKFLANFGWEVEVKALESVEVSIPVTFSPVYEKYNEIQIAQGFDLKKYSGKRVGRWTYLVTNYPDIDADRGIQVYANIIIYKDTVIGGDISSTEMHGFMHGFVKPNRN